MTNFSHTPTGSKTPLRGTDLAPLWNLVDADMIRGPDQASTRKQSNGRDSSLNSEAFAALITQLCKSSLSDNAEQTLGRVPLPAAAVLEAIYDNLSGPKMLRLDRANAKLNASAMEAVLEVSFRDEFEVLSSEPRPDQSSQQSWTHNFVTLCFKELDRARGTQRYGPLAGLARNILMVDSTPPEDLNAARKTFSPTQTRIIALLVQQAKGDDLIELREFSISLLGDLLEMDICTTPMLEALEYCLSDYTIDQQKGDVGSHLRIAALQATGLMLRRQMTHDHSRLVTKVCGLAVEKLDRVRHRAFACLIDNWEACGLASVIKPYVTQALHDSNCCSQPPSPASDALDDASVPYFTLMLSLCTLKWPTGAILEGFVTTAGGDYEAQIQASRTAFANYTLNLSQSELLALCNTIVSLLHKHSATDRLLTPTMELVAFLFESGIVMRLEHTDFEYGHPTPYSCGGRYWLTDGVVGVDCST